MNASSFQSSERTLLPHAQRKFQKGVSLHQEGKLDAAKKCYEAVLKHAPHHFDALHMLGVLAIQSRRPERAVELIKRAIEVDPAVAAAHNNLGNVLINLRRYEEAVTSFGKAIALQGDFAEAHNNRGVALHELERFEEALTSFSKAISLKADHAGAYSNRGKSLMDLKRSEEALASFGKAIELKPDYAEAHWGRGLCLLQMGRLADGWLEFEWRKDRSIHGPVTRSFSQPLWLGEPNIAGKTLFAWCEQGLGDTIQFCRYAKLLESRGVNVIMSAQRPLRELLKRVSATIPIIGPNDTPADFDYHCPLTSLPLAFGTTENTIPSEPRYILADAALQEGWRIRLHHKNKIRVGIAWSGSKSNMKDHYRSIALATLGPLLSDDIQWVCLQKEIRDHDLIVLRQSPHIAHYGEELDFSNTAAVIENLDLVIAVDTSIAHLAGAMGKPVWILLSYNPDWRWLSDRSDSPWYPSARLFRQRQFGDWTTVLDEVAKALRLAFNDHPAGAAPQTGARTSHV